MSMNKLQNANAQEEGHVLKDLILSYCILILLNQITKNAEVLWKIHVCGEQ